MGHPEPYGEVNGTQNRKNDGPGDLARSCGVSHEGEDTNLAGRREKVLLFLREHDGHDSGGEVHSGGTENRAHAAVGEWPENAPQGTCGCRNIGGYGGKGSPSLREKRDRMGFEENVVNTMATVDRKRADGAQGYNFIDYQYYAHTTADFPPESTIEYLSLGLAGEAGEVSNKVKKIIRDHGGVLTEDMRNKIIDELGDVLWYLSEMSAAMSVTLEDVAIRNTDKLMDRKEKGTIHGDQRPE